MAQGLLAADWGKWAGKIALHPITYYGPTNGAGAAAAARNKGGVAIAISNPNGQVSNYVVVRSDWATIVYGPAGVPDLNDGGDTGGGGNVTPAGLTNPASSGFSGGFGGGGGGGGRGASSTEGLGVDVKSDFPGLVSFPPDNQIGPQALEHGENVDGIRARGAIGKRPGLIPVRPHKTEADGEPPVLLGPVPDTHFGRSINMLPPGFREDGKSFLVLGYDDSDALGDGTSSMDTTYLRGVAAEILYNAQHDISHVKPIVAPAVVVADEIRFTVAMPVKYRQDLGDDAGIQKSVNQLVIVAAKNGYCLDRDIEDKLPEVRFVEEYTDWDGNSITIQDAGLEEGDVWFYTIWAVNEYEVSRPAFWTQEVVTPPGP